MARKIRLTKKADKRLDEILSYLENKFGQPTARNFINRTYSFFTILSEHPQIGMLEDSEKGIYGFVLIKQITVFYRFTDSEVIILNFFDNRMNPDKRLK